MIEGNDGLTKLRNASDDDGPIAERVHTWEIADPLSRRKTAITILNQLNAMPVPPETATEREFFGMELWNLLFHQFADKLSAADRECWKARSRGERNEKAPRIERAFNAHILEQFTIWGWRLLMSRDFLELLSEWETRDLAMVEQLGKNLVLRAKCIQEQTGGRIPIHAHEIQRAEKLIPELRILWRKVRKCFGKLKGDRTNSNLVEFIREEIEAHPQDYPGCADNLSNILGFVARCDADFAASVRSGRIRPERFLHTLLEKTTGRSWRDLRRLKN